MGGIFNDTGYNNDVLLTSTMVNNYSTFGVSVCFHSKKRKNVNTSLRRPFFSHYSLPLSFIVHSLGFSHKHKQDFCTRI